MFLHYFMKYVFNNRIRFVTALLIDKVTNPHL